MKSYLTSLVNEQLLFRGLMRSVHFAVVVMLFNMSTIHISGKKKSVAIVTIITTIGRVVIRMPKIYCTDHQIKRMRELIHDYERGRCDADTLYGFLCELNETQRDLTYEEENLIIEERREYRALERIDEGG